MSIDFNFKTISKLLNTVILLYFNNFEHLPSSPLSFRMAYYTTHLYVLISYTHSRDVYTVPIHNTSLVIHYAFARVTCSVRYTLFTRSFQCLHEKSIKKKSNIYFIFLRPRTGGRHAHRAGMAHAHPRLDSQPGRPAGAAGHHPFAPAAGPVLGHSHCFHTGRFGVHYVVGGDRRQPVRRRGRPDGRRTAARHRVPPMDRPRWPHAPVLRHRPVCHGGYRHCEYT